MIDILFSLDGSSSEWLRVVLDVAIKGSVLLLAVLFLAFSLRKRSASVRHGIWSLLFVGLLCIPALSFVLPQWKIPLPVQLAKIVPEQSKPPIVAPLPVDSPSPIAVQSPTVEQSLIVAPPSSSHRESLAEPQRADAGTIRPSTHDVDAGVPRPAALSELAGKRELAGNREPVGRVLTVELSKQHVEVRTARSVSVSMIVFYVWITGVVLSLIPLAVGIVANIRIAKRARRIDDPDWLDLVDELSAKLALRRNVELLEGDARQMPMTWGTVKPRILFPRSARYWPRDRRRTVLFHEMGHVKRWDVLLQIMARAVCSLYWFQPLVWMAMHRMRIDREHACDDCILNAGEKPTTYATHLLDLARTLHSPATYASAAIGMVRSSQLEGRMAAILDPHRSRRSLSRRTLFAAVFCLASFVLPLAAVNIGVHADEKAENTAPDKSATRANSNPDSQASKNARRGKGDREENAFPGLISKPAALPGIGRWQLMAATPRGFIRTVAWSPDGRRVSFGDSGTVRICNAENMQTVQVLVGHRGPVLSIAWSPDGTRIASSGRDGTVRIWTDAGLPLAVLTDHAAPVRGVAWSPDGQRLASAADDGNVRLWKADGTPVLTYKDHAAPVRCVAWSPDGTQLVSGDDDHNVRIWYANGKSGPVLKGHLGPVSAISWNPDGKRIASASLGNYYNRVAGERLSADVRVWDVAGALKQVLSGHRSPIIAVAWSPDGKKLASSGDGSGVYLWSDDGIPKQLRGASYEWAQATSLAWSPDSNRLIVGSLNTAQNLSIDGEGGPILQAKHQSSLPVVAWNRHGRQFASAGYGTNLRIWNTDGTPVRHFQNNKTEANSIAWSPDDERLATSGPAGIEFWQPNGKRESVIEAGSAKFMDWSPDAKTMAIASGTRLILVPLDEKFKSIQLRGHRSRITKVKWSPDGKWVASSSIDKTMRLWTASGDAGPTIKTHSGDIDALTWTADSKRIAVGYNNGDWQYWNVDGTPGISHKGHFESVMGLAASPDGKQIASAGWDYTVRLWNNDGKPLDTIEAHDAPVCYVAWSPDSKQFATAGWDRTLRVWSAQTRKSNTVIFFLDDDQTATFNAQGKLLDGDPAIVEENFLYLVEKPNGAIEIIRHAEFLKRTGQN